MLATMSLGIATLRMRAAIALSNCVRAAISREIRQVASIFHTKFDRVFRPPLANRAASRTKSDETFQLKLQLGDSQGWKDSFFFLAPPSFEILQAKAEQSSR